MTWRLTIPKWEGVVDAKAKVDTQASLKAEAQVEDNDLATDNVLLGG